MCTRTTRNQIITTLIAIFLLNIVLYFRFELSSLDLSSRQLQGYALEILYPTNIAEKKDIITHINTICDEIFTQTLEMYYRNHSFHISTHTIDKYNDLLQTTFNIFNSCINYTTKPFIIDNYRFITSLRRRIMMLYTYFNSHILMDHTLYTMLIQNIFVNIHLHSIKDIKNKSFYLIHLSKSAGTTICIMAKSLGYNSSDFCNLPNLEVPIKQEDIGSRSCQDLVNISDKYEFLAQEGPLTGHKISKKAILCDNYRYIMPTRHPMIRVASLLSEWNMIHYWPFQILIKLHNNTEPSGRRPSYDINGSVYESMTKAMDYSDFVSNLYFETDRNDTYIFKYDNHKHRGISYLDDKHQLLYNPNTSSIIYLFGKDDKYGIKTTEGFKHRANLEMIRGYCSNILSRFIGYEYNNTYAYDSIFDYDNTYEMKRKYWLNAMDIMTKIDYVLPFYQSIEHSIWDTLLLDLKKVHASNVKHWGHEQKSIGRILDTQEVMETWSDYEKQFILHRNKFDIRLYAFSAMIADVDMEFKAFTENALQLQKAINVTNTSRSSEMVTTHTSAKTFSGRRSPREWWFRRKNNRQE